MAENEKLVRPVSGTIVAVTGPNASPANLFNERLGRTAYGTQGTFIYIDVGSMMTIDTAAILATDSPSANVLWRVQGFANLSDAQQDTNELSTTGIISTWASPEAGRRLHRQAVGYLAPVPARIFRLSMSAPINIGRLVLGQSFTASDTADLGYSFKVVDLGDSRRSATALENSTIRGKVLEYSWTWSWMNEAEARGALLDIQAYAGTTRDILLIFNPDAPDLHNVIAYGKIVEEVESVNVSGGIGIDNAYEAKFRLQSRLILNL